LSGASALGNGMRTTEQLLQGMVKKSFAKFFKNILIFYAVNDILFS
jgi:hypothetical protein